MVSQTKTVTDCIVTVCMCVCVSTVDWSSCDEEDMEEDGEKNQRCVDVRISLFVFLSVCLEYSIRRTQRNDKLSKSQSKKEKVCNSF